MSMEVGIVIGSVGLMFFFFYMVNVMDDVFKKMKEYLIHWKHFWLSIGISSSLILTTTMKDLVVVDSTYSGIINIMNMAVTINIIIVVCWFFYLAVFTLLFYLNKFGNKKDELRYE